MSPRRPQEASKTRIPLVLVGSWPPRGPKRPPRGRQDGPRWPQDAPKRAQRRPQDAPSPPQDGTKTAPSSQDAPRHPQEGPKTPPRRPIKLYHKTAPGGLSKTGFPRFWWVSKSTLYQGLTGKGGVFKAVPPFKVPPFKAGQSSGVAPTGRQASKVL